MHEHEFQGQKLVHTHPGEDRAHGYFEHPEDGHPRIPIAAVPAVADALAEVDRAQNAVTADAGIAGELRRLRILAEAVRVDLTRPDAAPVAPSPSAAETGRYIVMRLVQLEEQLANHPRAFKDPRLASILGCIRDEAAGLAECYEFVPQAGQCEFCHLPDVPLVAALAEDTDAYVCLACHTDPANPTIPLEALQDDRAVYTITRGDLAASAGRELTEDEIAEVTGQMEDERMREAVDSAVFAAVGPLEADEGPRARVRRLAARCV